MKIIILHGWGHNAKLWASLAKKLGNDATSIDLPGFGSEPLVKDDWGIPDYSDWLDKKISNEEDVILIGHSFGGRICAEIASKQPKWLKGLVLSGAPCLYRPTLPTRIRIRIYKLLKIFLPNNLRSFFLTKDIKEAKDRNLSKIFRKVVVYDQTQQLKNINAPTLLIWGENDNQVPLRIAQEMKNLISNSELLIIEKAGHNSYLEKPDLFYGLVNNFISKHT